MTKILYVEDNKNNVYMLARRLNWLRFEIVVAPDGERGLAMARSERPELILMDPSLPILDGWEAARRLIALSAHAMAGDRDKALAAGCDEYDTKPVNLEHLLAKIRALLPPEGAAS